MNLKDCFNVEVAKSMSCNDWIEAHKKALLNIRRLNDAKEIYYILTGKKPSVPKKKVVKEEPKKGK